MKAMRKIKSILGKIMSSYMPTCEEVTRLKSESMDSALPIRQRLAIKIHILFCQWCRKYGKQLEMIRRAARKYQTMVDNVDREPSPLSPEFKDRLKDLLKD
jgi:hypothetical protein